MWIRARASAVAMAAMATVTAGCGGVDAAPVESTSAAQAQADYSAFVAAYRKEFPSLAKGRTDKAISNDVRGTCFALSEGKAGELLRAYVVGRFTAQDGTEPTAAQVDVIVALAKQTSCP